MLYLPSIVLPVKNIILGNIIFIGAPCISNEGGRKFGQARYQARNSNCSRVCMTANALSHLITYLHATPNSMFGFLFGVATVQYSL